MLTRRSFGGFRGLLMLGANRPALSEAVITMLLSVLWQSEPLVTKVGPVDVTAPGPVMLPSLDPTGMPSAEVRMGDRCSVGSNQSGVVSAGNEDIMPRRHLRRPRADPRLTPDSQIILTPHPRTWLSHIGCVRRQQKKKTLPTNLLLSWAVCPQPQSSQRTDRLVRRPLRRNSFVSSRVP